MTYLCHFPYAFLTAVFLAAPTFAAEPWPVKRGPSREPAPYHYDAKVWARTPRDFLDDYAACILYYGTNHIIEADGTVETTIHEITRLNGRKGIENLGEYRGISYDPSWQTLVLNQARVLKASGGVVELEPRHVHLRDVSTDYQVYDRDKQLVISFPNLEVGDCFEVKWTTRGKNPQYEGRFFGRLTFGDDQYPIFRDELRVRLPRTMPLHQAVLNGKVGHTDAEKGGERLVHWWSDQRRPMPQDSDRPSKETLRLQVMFSTFASWDEVGQWKEKLRAKCWTCTPEIREQVHRLTRGLKTPLEKARALTYWVRRSIRYVSISSTGAGYVPRMPGQVLSTRYGDCKDQAQLLAVMLKELGIDVSLVTLGTLDDGQVVRAVPSPWGTHGILLVTIDGKEHWIDTTASLAGWDFLPRTDRDRVAYVTQDAKLRLMKTPPLSYADNRIVQVTDLQVMPDGTSIGRRAMHYSGLAALGRRDAWMETPAGERRRLITAELQDANSRSRLLGFHVQDKELADLDKDVTARLDYTIPGHFAGDFSSREGSITDSNVWIRLLGYTLDPDRQTPLHLWTPFESVHRYVVSLPPAYYFDSYPGNQTVQSKWGSFELRVILLDRHRLEVTFHTRLEKAQVDPPDFAAFQEFHDAVYRHWRVYLTLKPTGALADAQALEFWQRLTLGGDGISTTVQGNLYLAQGRYADARRTLERARLLFPDDQTFWEMSVRAASGAGEEESLYAEMVRRFPKEHKYVLGLGATRVRLGDHAGAAAVLEPLTQLSLGPKTNRHAADAHVELARSAHAQHRSAVALVHLEAAQNLHPESLTAANLRFKADVYERLGRLDEAIACYREAIKNNQELEGVLPTLIRVELAAGRTSDALDSLRRFIVQAGKDRFALQRAVEFFIEMKRFDDALDLAQRARDLGFSGHTQRLLGIVYFHRGEFDKAVFHLERGDNSATAREHLLRSLIAQGKLHEAVQHFETALGSQETSFGLRQAEAALAHLVQRRSGLLSELGIVPGRKTFAAIRAIDAFVCAEYMHREGKPASEFAKLLDDALGGDVAIGPGHALRAQLALDRGNLRQALDDAERAVRHSPYHAEGYYLRGRVRLERGDYGALGDFRRAADLTRHSDGLILYWLSQAQHYVGQESDALTTLQLASVLLPRDQGVANALAAMRRASSAFRK